MGQSSKGLESFKSFIKRNIFGVRSFIAKFRALLIAADTFLFFSASSTASCKVCAAHLTPFKTGPASLRFSFSNKSIVLLS